MSFVLLYICIGFFCFFFFQAEDGIRDYDVTGVQTCALPIYIPPDHIISKEEVLKNLKGLDGDDYVAWIGHATFLIKLGNTTIITDPLFSKNAGPLIFGPKRYVDPAIDLKDIPEVNLYLLTHNHYDHLD